MPRRVMILLGHPDPAGGHFDHALAEACRAGAESAGHETRSVEVAALDFPLLRSARDYEHGTLPPTLLDAQRCLAWADHLVIVFPLWQGGMPALLKGLLEQVLRPDFVAAVGPDGAPIRPLRGKSAHVVVTMGMPAWVYRWFYRAHGVRALTRNVLKFLGFSPVRMSLIGNVEGMGRDARGRWLARMREAGRRAA